MNKSRTLLIIPCYNESASINSLLNEINTQKYGYDTLVIDDGSQDQTAEIALRLSPVLRLVANMGIGGCVQAGIKYALNQGYDYCVQIDGDGQHPPKEIIKLAKEKKISDLIIGSRYSGLASYKSTAMRRFGSRIISLAIRVLFGGRLVTDPTSGFRLMNRRAMSLFAREYPQDFPEPISIARALNSGLTIVEVPVIMRARLTGVSSLNGIGKSISYMVRVLAYVALARFQCQYVSIYKNSKTNND